jgi:tRNA G18 (ribose-2'-O)-methylase SpoU
MFEVRRIETFEDPALLPYRNMRRQYDHAEQEIFVAEGEKVLRRLLESDLTVISALFPEKWLEEYKPLLENRPETVQVFLAEKKLLQDLTGFSMYQGVLGLARIPRPASATEILKNTPRPHLFVAVDGLSNPENVGGLVRNCVAFGAQAIIVSETSCTPYLRRAVRSSMGTIFKLPYVMSSNLAGTIAELRHHGVRCIAAHPHTTRKNIFDADFSGDCCVALGSEGLGISKPVLESCDELVVIPMHSEVDSLNVGNAAAVFLYEINRQRSAELT